MPASIQTLAAALINDRTDKVIHNLLQTDVAAWNRIPVKGRKWSGDVSIIVCRVQRNGSVVAVSGNTEPAAGQQGFVRLTIIAKRVLGRMQIDLATMLSADDQSGSVAVEPADEMENLLNDFMKTMTRYAFLGGGGTQGSGNQPTESPIGVAWQRANNITQYGYRGRYDDIVAANQNVNFIRLRRLDNYAQVGNDTLLTAMDSRTFTLAQNIDTTVVPAGVGIGVYLCGAQSQALNDSTISGDNTPGNPVVFDPNGVPVCKLVDEMTGFISNLTQVTHFGNDRSSTTDPKMVRLRSNFLVVNNTNALGGDVLDGVEFDKLAARIRSRSGQTPDAYWMSWESHIAYGQSLFGTNGGNVRVDAQAGPKNLDPAAPVTKPDQFQTGYGRGGIPVCCSELCPDGIAIAMQYRSWERLYKGPQEGFWVGQGGINKDPIYKLQGETQYGATRALFPEQVCTAPLANGILLGIADPS